MIFQPSNINNKIVTPEQLMFHLRGWKVKGFVIGFTNGCFDLLHRGHVSYLEETKKYCSKLVVAINSDASVKMLNKGSNRPVNQETDRAYVLSGLVFVDYVVVFDEATPLSLIELVKPDYLFKGGDYDAEVTDSKNPKYIVGSDVVKKNGGEVMTIPLVQGFSTTNIIEKAHSA
jgi:D-beta-D-heptose 7-phosphate kinase/D-beta-D-heptose 1-phosphate adenosyltransferase